MAMVAFSNDEFDPSQIVMIQVAPLAGAQIDSKNKS